MNTGQSPATLHWFKSSHSGGAGGECVEVATTPATVHVRDSEETAGGALAVSPRAWRDFVAVAKES